MSLVLSLRILGTMGLTLFVAAAFTPLPHALSRRLTLVSSLEPAGAIVVLAGGGVRHDGSLTDISLRRTVYGLDLYRRGLAPLLVFSGSASRHGYVEAEIRAELARACGVPPVAILAQPEGHTTSDEASRVAALLQRRGIRKILLVVDAEGSRRAAGAFARVGLEAIPVPADEVSPDGGDSEGSLALFRRVAIESFAWLYYRVAGYL